MGSGIASRAGRFGAERQRIPLERAQPADPGTHRCPTVTATDSYGNRIAGYLGTIHFTSTDIKASLPPNYTFVAADAGTHVFSAGVILETVGTWSVTATDTANASITGSQAGIVVR